MKKALIIVMGFLVISIMSLTVFLIFNKEKKDIKFKNEYESLNNELKSDGINKHMEIKINETNKMYYATMEEVKNVFAGTGVIYFGFPECPWCRNAVPELIEVTNNSDIEKIYYYSDMSIRDTLKLDENNQIITEKEGTEDYKFIINKLSSFLESYKGLNDDQIKRLYVPTVVFVKSGKVIGLHSGTVESQTDPSVPLNKDQKKELQNKYKQYLDQLSSDTCQKEVEDAC